MTHSTFGHKEVLRAEVDDACSHNDAYRATTSRQSAQTHARARAITHALTRTPARAHIHRRRATRLVPVPRLKRSVIEKSKRYADKTIVITTPEEDANTFVMLSAYFMTRDTTCDHQPPQLTE